jgi:hypothetical protein
MDNREMNNRGKDNKSRIIIIERRIIMGRIYVKRDCGNKRNKRYESTGLLWDK